MDLKLSNKRLINKENEIKDKIQLFREEFYPKVNNSDWNNWKWQLRNRITSKEELIRLFNLSERELSSFSSDKYTFPLSITPYYASLIDKDDENQPIRKSVIPTMSEHNISPVELCDPLAEDSHTPTKCIVHRYPDRVLFLVTNCCSVYCRYCTRSRMVGGHSKHNDYEEWEKAIKYIKSHPEIRDVLLSGGDPLIMETAKIEWILSRLRKIEHVEFIRIGTKVPVVLPQRINTDLVNVLKKYHPLWMSIHFIHPDELTPETQKACEMLADAGIPLGSQTVLLKGINDNIETMTKLCQGLLKIRVKPYYLYQCDLVPGSSHFRTSIQRGIDIIDKMRGYTSGYAVPHYIIDAPKGGGKIRILPEAIVEKSEDKIFLKNYLGEIYSYPITTED